MKYFTPVHGGVTAFVAIAVTSLQCVTGSDDVSPLEPVVSHLSQVVNQLQAKLGEFICTDKMLKYNTAA